MRVALDSNILIYAQGFNDQARRDCAAAAIELLADTEIIIPAQVLAEFFAVLTRKFGQTTCFARNAVLCWRESCVVAPTTERVLLRAADLATDHRLGIWDAVIFAAAAEASCDLLLSEDMQDGFVWGGVRVLNPLDPSGLARLRTTIGS